MDIVPALTAMRLGIQLATDVLAACDDAKLKQAIGALSQQLADANMGALDMSQTLRKIEAELRASTDQLRAAEKRLAERDNYVLEEVRPAPSSTPTCATLRNLRPPTTFARYASTEARNRFFKATRMAPSFNAVSI